MHSFQSLARFSWLSIFVCFSAGCGSHNDGAAQASDAQIPSHEVAAGATSTPMPNPSASPSVAPAGTPQAVSTPAPTPVPTPVPTSQTATPVPSPTPSVSSVPPPVAQQNPSPPPTSAPGTGSGAALHTNPNASAIPWPSLDFNDNPGGHDPTAIALTFDDGPDGYSGSGGVNNTGYILDQLKALGVHGTFFLCDHVWTEVGTDPLAQQDIQRMISEGHDVGNHTYDHNNLSNLTAAQIDTEFSQNASSLAIPQALGAAFQMSMYRAPFGVPYEDNTSDVARTAVVTAKYGVHVGWGIESNDWDCAQAGLTSKCIVDNVNAQLDAGRTGIILMHAVYRITGDALPGVVQAIAAHGLHIVSVEQMIQQKYGMTSAQIMATNASANFSSSDIATAAQNACGTNNFEIYAPYPNGTTNAE